jgi:hypothetical protein
MGATSSKNVINSVLTEVIEDYNNDFQSAWMSCANINEIDINNCDVENTTFIQDSACSLNQHFNATTSIDNVAKQCEKSQIKQLAEAMSQNMSLNPASTTAENITNLSMSAINKVTNNISQNCTASTTGLNKITCKGGGRMVGDTFDQQEKSNSFNDCVDSSKIKNEASQALSSIIDQHSKAVQKNAIFWILIATAILFISFGISKKLGGQEIIEWVIILLIVLAVTALLMLVIYEAFNHNKHKTTEDDACPDCTQINNCTDCQKGLCLWVDKNDNTTPIKTCGDKSPPGTCICDKGGNYSCANQCGNFTTSSTCNDNKCLWNSKGLCIGGPECRDDRRNKNK